MRRTFPGRSRFSPTILFCCALFLYVATALACCAADIERVKVKVEGYDPVFGQTWFTNLVCSRLMAEDPELECVPHVQMVIAGGPGYEASRYMAHAGGIAPDVITWVEFHNMRSYIRQGFFLPLNEFIGEDQDGDGYISDQEAVWPDWKNVPEFYRRVATIDGKVYGIPNVGMGMGSLVFRKDLFRKEGLDPDAIPRDWDAFYRMLQELTRPKLAIPGARIPRGRRGTTIEPAGWQFCAWVWAGGGEIVMQGKKNPRTGKTHWYTQEELEFRDPETGEDLGRYPSVWKATFADDGGRRALQFYRRMRFAPWIRHPDTDEPIDLTEDEVEQGFVALLDGTRLEFEPADVIEGVARVLWGADNPLERGDLLRRGEVAMIYYVCEPELLRMLDIPQENLGFMPVPPAEPGLNPGMLAQYHFRCLNAELEGEKHRRKREKAWKILSTMNGGRGARWQVEKTVRAGLSRFLDPATLRRYGMTEYLDAVPEDWLWSWEVALAHARTEPFEGFWPPIKTKILNNDVLSLALTQRDFDYNAALVKAQRDANAGLMFARPEHEMARYRPWGWFGVGLWGAALAMLAWHMIRVAARRKQEGDVVQRGGPLRIAWGPALLLAPALVSVAVWQYYPLGRGALMAFQDYKVVGDSQWTGVDNFVNIFLDPNFYLYLRKTFKYVFLSIGLGFFAPVILAVLLSEVPRGKVFFRTVFFLPQVSSALVILLLWRLFYDPAPYGFLNKLLWFIEPVDWLGSPQWAMIAVILPGVWASAGISSLIYLAAMKSIPEDLYEAAAADGAGVWRRIRYVTIPSLLPLLVINFLGAFIGTFHAMSNIFAMTAGGPGNETMVMSLAIWYEAFAFLRFGTATAMAWILGSMLIGFTVWQLRFLRKVEFRRAAIE